MAEPLRRFEAVVFDLFGTLVHEFPKADWEAWFAEAAAVLGADPNAFRRAWEATSVERQTGRLGDMTASVLEVSRRAGAPMPSADRIARAMELRMELYRRWFHPMPGAEETLAFVRAEGLPSALVSMCAPDTPPLWRVSSLASSVDVEVFSSEVGLRKPDPEIYRYAADALGVEPNACLYVGDGSYRELSGAAATGMYAVLVLDPAVDPTIINRPEVEDWDGRRIARLDELIPMLRT